MSQDSHEARARVERLLPPTMARLRAFVKRRAGSILARKESSSDLVQSTCREALERSSSFGGSDEVAFRRWIYRTAERKILDRARRWRAVRRDADREIGGGELAESASRESRSPSREAMLAEEIERLELAISSLAPAHREVVMLARLSGLPHREVARRMGRSEGAVRVLLFRALAELSQRLDVPDA